MQGSSLEYAFGECSAGGGVDSFYFLMESGDDITSFGINQIFPEPPLLTVRP